MTRFPKKNHFNKYIKKLIMRKREKKLYEYAQTLHGILWLFL